MKPHEDLQFSVEVWSVDGARWEETIARAGNVAIAHAAFDAALACRPQGRLKLRHGARLLRDTHPPEPELQPRSLQERSALTPDPQ